MKKVFKEKEKINALTTCAVFVFFCISISSSFVSCKYNPFAAPANTPVPTPGLRLVVKGRANTGYNYFYMPGKDITAPVYLEHNMDYSFILCDSYKTEKISWAPYEFTRWDGTTSTSLGTTSEVAYKADVSHDGQDINAYFTKDGSAALDDTKTRILNVKNNIIAVTASWPDSEYPAWLKNVYLFDNIFWQFNDWLTSPAQVIKAIALRETRFDACPTTGDGHGLMQVRALSTESDYAELPYTDCDPYLSVFYGAYKLRSIKNRFTLSSTIQYSLWRYTVASDSWAIVMNNRSITIANRSALHWALAIASYNGGSTVPVSLMAFIDYSNYGESDCMNWYWSNEYWDDYESPYPCENWGIRKCMYEESNFYSGSSYEFDWYCIRIPAWSVYDPYDSGMYINLPYKSTTNCQTNQNYVAYVFGAGAYCADTMGVVQSGAAKAYGWAP